AVLAWVLFFNGGTESLFGVSVSLVTLALLTLASLWRTTQAWPVADSEFLAQLVIDIVGWTALMYFTGGANNPFISYYIVPLVISATVLPWRFTWLVAGASIAAYSLMLYVHRPFPLFTPHTAMGHGNAGNIHILGMWFNFLFSASLITYFVVRMATTLRRQEEQAGIAREDHLRNDQIMAVAGLAAGTAHELGTPLSTMSVLVEEMLADKQLPEQSRQDCQLLQEQLQHCKSTLAELSRTAELTSVQQTSQQSAEAFAGDTLEHWAVRRPGTAYSFSCARNSPHIEVELTLAQALENLLNNAADTGTDKIAVDVGWDTQQVRIGIRDWGPGIAPRIIEQLGKPVIQANKSGLGIGLMLSHAAVERCGGHIELHNQPDGGVLATMALPLSLQSPKASAQATASTTTKTIHSAGETP
ncbi:MAG: two-component system sensor histidine kinase RegB, partial [Bacteroidia bacterium]